MRFIFKTSYDQDIDLAKHGGHRLWYGLLLAALVLAPVMVDKYWLSQLTFMLIFGITALGLMLLAGYTGLFSLGHAAFMGVGAYTEGILAAKGWPFPVSISLAILVSAGFGALVGIPALRLKGLYLAIATLAFGFVVEEIFVRWESVTGGSLGLMVPPIRFGDWAVTDSRAFYLLCLALAVLTTVVVLNLLRSPTGRAFIAIRDSEVSAQSMGIKLSAYKTRSFMVSAALAGLGGGLYAHHIRYVSPDQFGLHQSIELLMMVVLGGLGSVHGAFLGAGLMIALPQLISIGKDYLPALVGQAPGLQSLVFGMTLVLFVLFEPTGIYGRWLKVRAWLQWVPLYRRGTYKRQKSFQKSERIK